MEVLRNLAAILKESDLNIGLPTKEGTMLFDILNTVYFWATVVAVIVIIVGGILYTLSAGDHGSITRAKNAILGACIGLVVVFFAYVITRFVVGAV